VSADRQALAADLDLAIGQASARAHSAMKDLATAAAEFDELGGWSAGGIRSFPHWLAINAGFDVHQGSELLRVGKALQCLPRIAEAFGAGRLSFDKVRQLTTVATPATEELLLEIGLGASGSQLARICTSLRRIARAEELDHDERAQAERGLWTEWGEDGMMRLVARLPAEDAAVVMAAIESVVASRPLQNAAGSEVVDPAEEPWAARRADALVAICDRVLAGAAEDLVPAGAARQVVVHVDVGVLTGEMPLGRCDVDRRMPLSSEAARRIGCDAEVVALTERDGLPIDVGRKHRIVPDRLRRALEVRDRFCRFPGCGVPAHMAEAHHVDHWADGGRTDRDNVLMLCGFHHRRHHGGGYTIRKTPGGFSFETHDGHVIGSRALGVPHTEDAITFVPESARAEWGGVAMDLDHTVWVLTHHIELAQARPAPPD
jgi:hypothetical protein